MGCGSVGIGELIVIFLILVLIFGASRLTNLFGALGKGVREFKKGASGEDEEETKKKYDEIK
jgi:sec-independent protein translocase protein TatA